MRWPVALLLAAIVAAAAFFLLTRHEANDPLAAPPVAERVAETPPAAAPPLDAATLAGAHATRDAAADLAANGPPASYRKALGSLVGRVVESDGTPCAGLTVQLVGGNLVDFVPPREALFEPDGMQLAFDGGAATTGGGGRFRIDDVDPRAFFVLAIDANGPRSRWWPVVAMPNPGQVLDLGDIVLEPFATFQGRVVDEEGAPIAGARVRAAELPQQVAAMKRFAALSSYDRARAVAGFVPGGALGPAAAGVAARGDGGAAASGTRDEWLLVEIPTWLRDLAARLPIPATTTDADGHFRLEGVPRGLPTMWIDHEAMLPLARGPVATSAGGTKDFGDLEMTRGEEIHGLVVDGEDRAVAGALVLAGERFPLWPAALLVPCSGGGVTGADGRFVVRGVSTLAYDLAVRGPDATSFMFEHDVVGGDEPVIRLAATFALAVTARDPLRANEPDGGIVRHPKIAVRRADPITDALPLLPNVDVARRVRPRADGSMLVSGLSAGRFNVFVAADGYAVAQAEAVVGDGGDGGGPAALEVLLSPAAVGHVQVVSAHDGAPIEYALVSAYESDAAIEFLGGPTALVTRRTDRNGFVELPGLEPGAHRVSAFHPAFAMNEAVLAAPGPPVILELRGGGSLAGRVLVNGALAPEPYVVFAMPAGGFGGIGGGGGANDGAEGGAGTSLPRLTMTGDDATFRITHLAAGVYEVTAMPYARVARFGGGGGGDGDRARAANGGGGVRISTRVNANEVPESDAVIGGGGDSDSGGIRFSAGYAPDEAEAEQPKLEAVVHEGRETWLDVDVARQDGMQETARLLGVVTVNGRPQHAIRVTAEAASGAARTRDTTTNASGIFDLGLVPAGRLVVTAARGGDVIAVRVVTLARDEAGELAIHVESGSVAGRVVSAQDGRAVGFATVSLLPQRADPEASPGTLVATSDEAGAFAFDVVPEGDWLLIAERSGFARATVGPIAVPARGAPAPVHVAMLEAVSVEGSIQLPPGAGAPPYLFLLMRPAAEEPDETAEPDLGSFAFVDPASLEFELTDVAPGKYDVHLFGTPADLAPVPLDVPPTGLAGTILRPALKVP